MAQAKVFVGVDVSKAWLDVAIEPGGKSKRVENNAKGIREMIGCIRSLPLERSLWKQRGDTKDC